ncbi:Plasmodium vivax Vir protein, putative [Plasmodium vivax]|uniref:Vir protein, putative n=1 Tax=Plasmodium vivax TaxID=5855 RepID=A0A1G4E4T1_PLAVI|nr:Plasmodium vivax Vir protein, putative [Plasmodium vivax]
MGPETCCNYINYWLNKTVRDSEYNVNKQNFNIFDKFMQDDPKIKEGPTTCKSKLSYMDNETFEKMKKLYDLYDYFTELKKRDDLSSLCHNISDIAKMYENVLQECKEKDNLWYKLTNLRHNQVRQKKYQHNVETMKKHIPELLFQFLHHKHMVQTLEKRISQAPFQSLYHTHKDWKNKHKHWKNKYKYWKNK